MFTHQIKCRGSDHNMVKEFACFESFYNFHYIIMATLCQKISLTKFQKSEIWDDCYEGISAGFILVYFIFSVDTFSMEKFANQNGHFSTFWYNLTLWNKGNFVVENLCDKVSKIKNLSWQFRWIFRRLCHGVLHFFCRHFFYGEIYRSNWPLFDFLG